MPARLLNALDWAARREGFAIEREDCGAGPGDSLIFWNARRIRARPGLPGEREARTILHQLGHIILHRHLADPPCATAGACDGVLRLEADSVAFVIGDRFGASAPNRFPPVGNWAGTDPRASPELAVRAAGTRITSAVSLLTTHLAGSLPDPAPAQRAALGREVPVPAPADRVGDGHRQVAGRHVRMKVTDEASSPPAVARVPFSQVLADAERFYLTRAPGSWVPAYLRSRGLDDEAAGDWRIGHAPAGWTALLDHLRALGHSSAQIEAAGLARRSARGTLIDHFRDRAMFAIRDEHGTIAGFIGRARPGAAERVPKYLNSPQTASYSKGDLLLGLCQARRDLASGAVPVLAEGPFDAIAITSCAPGQFAGLAACGTALTSWQVAALSRLCDLEQRGVLVASDGDEAGRQSAMRAYHILRDFTSRAAAVTFPPGEDPAAILQSAGSATLAQILRGQAQPLGRLVIEAEISSRLNGTDSPHEALLAMRSMAQYIGGLLPGGLSQEIRTLTGGQMLRAWDDDLRPVHEPAVVAISRLLTGDTPSLIAAVAERLGFDHSEVIIEMANALTCEAARPKGVSGPSLRPDVRRGSAPLRGQAGRLAASSFPPCSPAPSPDHAQPSSLADLLSSRHLSSHPVR